MDLTTVRLYGSLAIILGCFFFLYPKLMHPLIMTLFGMNQKPPESRPTVPNDLPPYLREKAQMAEAKSAGVRDDMPDHIKRMRSGPHPGMRAAAEQNKQQTRGSGKGMMGVILPMYAVGIVVYLIYTLFKVFNKKDDKQRGKKSPTRNIRRIQECYEDNGDYSEEEGRVSRHTKDLVTPQDLQNELQSLVDKVQDKNLTEMDMRKLQERLAETEAQMTKILAAMQAVQGKVDATTTSAQDQCQTESCTHKSGSHEDISNNPSSEDKHHTTEEDNKKQQETSTIPCPGSLESPESYTLKLDKEPYKNTVETIHSTAATETDGHLSQIDINQEEKEPEEMLMEEKKHEESVTVRQRLTKKEDTDT